MRSRALVILSFAATVAACSSHATSSPDVGSVVPDIVQNGQSPGHWQVFPIPSPKFGPVFIAAGAHDDLWFEGGSTRGGIGRVDMNGNVTVYSTPTQGEPTGGATAGADSNEWFGCGIGFVCSITTGGVINQYSLGKPVLAQTRFLGPDGNVWFIAGGDAMGTVSASGNSRLFSPAAAQVLGIVEGPDGNVWLSGDSSDGVGFLGVYNLNGSLLRMYSLPHLGQVVNAIASSRKLLWFEMIDQNSGINYLASMTTSGRLAEYPLPGRTFLWNGVSLTVGSDGNIYDLPLHGGVLRFSPKSKTWLSTLNGPAGTLYDWGSASGPDGNLWLSSIPKNDVSVYIIHDLNVSPSSLTFNSIGQTQDLLISERKYRGSWTAVSENTGVATVTGPVGNVLTVTSVGQGSTTIQVSDTTDNSFNVQVTVL